MKIQNPAMAGSSLTLRFARDAEGAHVTVTGDEKGVCEVPEKDAEFLLKTPGWKLASAGKPTLLAPAAAPAKAPAVVVQPPTLPSPEPELLNVPVPEGEGAMEEVGPDLEALDKDGLLAAAKEYGVEVKKSWSEAKLREALDKALYGKDEG